MSRNETKQIVQAGKISATLQQTLFLGCPVMPPKKKFVICNFQDYRDDQESSEKAINYILALSVQLDQGKRQGIFVESTPVKGDNYYYNLIQEPMDIEDTILISQNEKKLNNQSKQLQQFISGSSKDESKIIALDCEDGTLVQWFFHQRTKKWILTTLTNSNATYQYFNGVSVMRRFCQFMFPESSEDDDQGNIEKGVPNRNKECFVFMTHETGLNFLFSKRNGLKNKAVIDNRDTEKLFPAVKHSQSMVKNSAADIVSFFGKTENETKCLLLIDTSKEFFRLQRVVSEKFKAMKDIEKKKAFNLYVKAFFQKDDKEMDEWIDFYGNYVDHTVYESKVKDCIKYLYGTYTVRYIGVKDDQGYIKTDYIKCDNKFVNRCMYELDTYIKDNRLITNKNLDKFHEILTDIIIDFVIETYFSEECQKYQNKLFTDAIDFMIAELEILSKYDYTVPSN